MLPKAKSTFLLIADIIPTNNSGSDVPNAISDNPITASETLYFLAISIAELTNKSEPKTKKIIPNTININEIIITHSLFERKEKFLSMSDAFIVLPGGVGSMDELLEVMVSNQLGGINKPVGLLNTNGYYNGFLDWLQRSVDDEFVSEENQRQIHVSENPKELLEMILSAKMPSSDTWIERLNVDFPRD